MTKIETEWNGYHGHSNHKLKVNTVILIQIIKHVDALFLRDIHFCEFVRIVYMFFLPLYLNGEAVKGCINYGR
jgi:hypothetical protein